MITLFVHQILEDPRTDPSPILCVTAQINYSVVQLKVSKKVALLSHLQTGNCITNNSKQKTIGFVKIKSPRTLIQ